jgi:hypothetical protein
MAASEASAFALRKVTQASLAGAEGVFIPIALIN